MASFLHTMVRITDPERSRSFYEALGFAFSRDLDIVRDGELEAHSTRIRFSALGEVLSLLVLRPRAVPTSGGKSGTSPLRSIQAGISQSNCANRSGLKRKSRSVIFEKSGSGPRPKSS